MTDEIPTILNMDQEREPKWTFGAMKKFGQRAREVLRKQKVEVRNDRGQLLSIGQLGIGFMLSQFLRIEEVMEAAVAATCGLSYLEGKDGSSEASKAIDAYMERGGDMETLERSIFRAYLVASDPSSIQEWEANLGREVEARRINKEKQEARMEIARLELQNDQKKIDTLKGISGAAPTSSPT
jgi:hypothetical protein